MKAVGYYQCLPVDNSECLQDIDVKDPVMSDEDLLINIKAVSVNPIDVKTRTSAEPTDHAPRILGFDAAGVVIDMGKNVQGFKKGDEVFYAGSIHRDGSNAQMQAIDYRIVAHKPESVDFKTAASLPLTTLTSYEMLFERMNIKKPVHDGKNALLMVPGAGGIGSIAIQLARHFSDAVIIATASRPETKDWALKMGAHHVIDHSKTLASQLEEIGFAKVAYIFSTANSGGNRLQYADIIAPQGHIGLIDGPQQFDIVPFKAKSIALHWESMFTRSLYTTSDIARQGEILAILAKLVDEGTIKPTLTKSLAPINAENLRKAHQMIETGKTIGKIVLEGF